MPRMVNWRESVNIQKEVLCSTADHLFQPCRPSSQDSFEDFYVVLPRVCKKRLLYLLQHLSTASFLYFRGQTLSPSQFTNVLGTSI